MAQIAEIGAILVFVGGLTFVVFKILSAVKLLRVARRRAVRTGHPEMGVPGYTQVDVIMPGGRLSPQMPASRPASAPLK